MANNSGQGTTIEDLANLAKSSSMSGGVKSRSSVTPTSSYTPSYSKPTYPKNTVYGFDKKVFNGDYTTKQIIDAITARDSKLKYTTKETQDLIKKVQNSKEFKNLVKTEKNGNGMKARIFGAVDTASFGLFKKIPTRILSGNKNDKGNLGDYAKTKFGADYQNLKAYKQGQFLGYFTPTGLEKAGLKLLGKTPVAGKLVNFAVKEAPKFVKPTTNITKAAIKYGAKETARKATRGAIEGAIQGTAYEGIKSTGDVVTGQKTVGQAVKDTAVAAGIGAAGGAVLNPLLKGAGLGAKAAKSKALEFLSKSSEKAASQETNKVLGNARDEYVSYKTGKKGNTIQALEQDIKSAETALETYKGGKGKQTKASLQKEVNQMKRIRDKAKQIHEQATTENFDIVAHDFKNKGVTKFDIADGEHYVSNKSGNKVSFQKVKGEKVDVHSKVHTFYHYDPATKTHNVVDTVTGQKLSSIADSEIPATAKGFARKKAGKEAAISAAKKSLKENTVKKHQLILSNTKDVSPAVTNRTYVEPKISTQSKLRNQVKNSQKTIDKLYSDLKDAKNIKDKVERESTIAEIKGKIEQAKKEIESIKAKELKHHEKQSENIANERALEMNSELQDRIKSVKDKIKTTNLSLIGKFIKNFQNKNHAFREMWDPLVKEAEKGDYKLFDLSNNVAYADNVAYSILKNGMLDKNGNVVGKSFYDIVKDLSKEQYTDLESYMINQRAIDRYQRGELVYDKLKDGTVLTPSEYKAMNRALEQKHPEIKQWAKDYRDFEKGLNKLLIQKGILDKAAQEAFDKAEPNYVSNRRINGNGVNLKQSPKGFRKADTTVMERGAGSTDMLMSPLDAIMDRVSKVTQSISKNDVMVAMYDDLAKYPERFKDIAEIVKLSNKEQKKLNQAVSEMMSKGNQDAYLEDMANNFSKLIDKEIGSAHGKNIAVAIIEGKPVAIRIHDSEIADVIKNMNEYQARGFLKYTAKAVELWKSVTTRYNPLFTLTKAALMDIPHGFATSKSTSNLLKYMFDLVKAVSHVYRNSEQYQVYQNLGNGMSGFVGSQGKILEQARSELLKPANLREYIKKYFDKNLKRLEHISTGIEDAPRFAEFQRMTNKLEGGKVKYDSNGSYITKITDEEYPKFVKASKEARSVIVNARQSGKYGSDIEAAGFGYFKFAMNSLDQVYQAAKRNPAKFTMKSLQAITLPAMALYMYNHDKKEYKMLDQMTKDTNFCFVLPDGKVLKIPIPYELGFVFKVLPEHLMNAVLEKDPKAFDFNGAMNVVSDKIAPPVASGVAKFAQTKNWNDLLNDNALVGPLAQVAANKNSFGGPIQSRSVDQFTPGNQYTPNQTTPGAKYIGKKLGISPTKLDYVAKQYSGGIGQLSTPLIMPNQSIAKTVQKRFVVDPYVSNDILTNFYKRHELINQKFSDFKGYRDLSPTQQAFYKTFINKAFDQISTFQAKKREVANNNTLSEKEKQKEIAYLQKQIIMYAENALNVTK